MQAVMNHSSASDFFRFASGRNYMMRSEKRGSSGSMRHAPAPGKKPPRRKRRRAGFFYKLFTMLLLLTLWPVGLMLLWRRKVRWSIGTKLLTSIVTLAACIVLIGFALTVNTDNPQYTAVQDSVNIFLDEAADTLLHLGEIVGEQAEIISEGVSDLSDALWFKGRLYLADGIDTGVRLAQNVKQSVGALLKSAAVEPETTSVPEANASVTAESTLPAEATADAAAASPAPAATNSVAATITVNTDAETLPIFMPNADSEMQNGQTIGQGTLQRAGNLILGEVSPTAEPVNEIFPSATLEPLVFTIKSAENATVFYNDGGKCYHKTSACASMKTSTEHVLGDTRSISNHRCSICGTPEKSIMDETHIVWTDAENVAHLSDECSAFSGSWNLIPAAEAIEKELTGCPECSADLYLRAVAADLDVVIRRPESDAAAVSVIDEEPTAEPTAAPTAEPTAEPTPEPTTEPVTVVPTVTLKPAGEAVVYHSSNGRFYHAQEVCSNMTGSNPYTLAECVQGYKRCNACNAPDAQLVDQPCLWEDENKLCHVSDECSAFSGRFTLILRDDALADELLGCTVCKADEYLLPNSIINYDDILPVLDPAA